MLFLGIRPVDFLGNFYMTNSTEMIFGTIDADKSVSVELKHDDKLPNDSKGYIQVSYFRFSYFNKQTLPVSFFIHRLRYFILVYLVNVV